jgi:hypothetical protein
MPRFSAIRSRLSINSALLVTFEVWFGALSAGAQRAVCTASMRSVPIADRAEHRITNEQSESNT